MPINKELLQAESYYWARRENGDEPEIVQISSIFGEGPDYMTVAVMGSDQHHSLGDFEFMAEIIRAGGEPAGQTRNVVTFPELKRMKS